MHQARNIFFALLCGGLSVSAQEAGFDFSGEDVDEGYTFTEEDVAEADEQEMMALIGNAAKYEQACMAEYNKIINAFNKCFKEIQAINDELECTDHPAPAIIFNKYYNELLDIGCYGTGSGQFLEGVLNRSNLAKARAGMADAQYSKCDTIITRSELMLRWYTGPFRNACLLYHEDFMKMLQQSARFQLYLKENEKICDAFQYFHEVFDADLQEDRLHTIVVTFRNNDEANSRIFFNHFHNKISTDERDRWLSHVVLGGRSHSKYTGPTYGVQEITVDFAPWRFFDIRSGRVVLSSSYLAFELTYYMDILDKWTLSYLDNVKISGVNARIAAGDAVRELEALIKQTENEVLMNDNNFRNVVYTMGNDTLAWMQVLVAPMANMNDFLDKTDFKKHKSFSPGIKPLLEKFQKHVGTASEKLDDMYDFADKVIPRTHQLRKTD